VNARFERGWHWQAAAGHTRGVGRAHFLQPKDGDPERVARVYGRFGAMVLMPSEVTLRIFSREQVPEGDAVFFETTSADDGRAIRDGFVLLRP
jgi:hypothetical protein